MDKFIDGTVQVLGLVLGSSSTAALSAVGLILLLLTAIFAYIALKSKPEDIPPFLKSALFLCLAFGLIFSAAGPSLALFYVSQDPIQKSTFNTTFNNLVKNKRVRYVIRLIADPTLTIEKLSQLGPSKQKYSFVADYEELKGYTVKEALDLIGTGYAGEYHVSGIIFPLTMDLYPANARGLLQVVRKVETDSSVEENKRLLGSGKLNSDELNEFDDIGIPSYQVDNFKKFYPHYCELAKTFFCGQYAAKELIGGLYRDWHPLGFSQRNPPARPCATENFCAFTDWDKMKQDLKSRFGVRAFLIENLEISKIAGRMLFDFQHPEKDRIPELGLAPSQDE